MQLYNIIQQLGLTMEDMGMNIFWFKRDLRIEDNEALQLACDWSKKLLLIYIMEPSLMDDSHTSERHVNFVKESLQDLNLQLESYDTEILVVKGEVLSTLSKLNKMNPIDNLFSTQEIGINLTYKRDLSIKRWCTENKITWSETQCNGVIRGLNDRTGWKKAWYKYMTSEIQSPDIEYAHFVSLEEVKILKLTFETSKLTLSKHKFQKGGRTQALKWSESFFTGRILQYSEGISKPELSRKTCSRLSPYFAWGNLSIREIYQRAMALKKVSVKKRPISAFISRLHWQSHFIQKFEMEPRMEFEAVNRAFLELKQPRNEDYINAWMNGQTGYPLVDASIRALKETGYLNFRMRTMITSFFCHHLFQHFKEMGPWLAQQFLDFEPGIHYGQLQMQAGFTGTNTIRIYNPTKNALDHDGDAEFIKNWVPELENLPVNLAIEPWNITPMEEALYDFKLGASYPERIIDMSVTRKEALTNLHGMRKTELFKEEKKRVLDKHTIKRSDHDRKK